MISNIKNQRGSSIIVVMFILFGLGLIASSVGSMANVSISNSLIKSESARKTILLTKNGWDLINSDVNKYFKAADLAGQQRYSALPSSNRFHYISYRGGIKYDIRSIDYNNPEFSEMNGLFKAQSGTDANTVTYYFYNVRISGYVNSNFKGPNSTLEVFVKQQGRPVNN